MDATTSLKLGSEAREVGFHELGQRFKIIVFAVALLRLRVVAFSVEFFLFEKLNRGPCICEANDVAAM